MAINTFFFNMMDDGTSKLSFLSILFIADGQYIYCRNVYKKDIK